jgi:hypothetical protein
VKIHGLDLEHLTREGKTRREALDLLTAWSSARRAPAPSRASWGTTRPSTGRSSPGPTTRKGLQNPFGYKAMCTKSVAMGALGIHWLDTSKEVLSERLKLPAEDMEQKHRADYDALYQAKILMGCSRAGWKRARESCRARAAHVA